MNRISNPEKLLNLVFLKQYHRFIYSCILLN